MNTKLHAVADANDRPLGFLVTARPASDYAGAAGLLSDLPKAQWLLGDRGHDADRLGTFCRRRASTPAFHGASSTGPVRHDKRGYRRRSRTEIMFERLKDCRRVAIRYDRCPTVVFSAIAFAATGLLRR